MVKSLRRRGQPRESALADWGDRISFDESFRILRSNLSVALADIERPAVIVTSANANEGKTLVCCNLAVSFAAAGYRTVLVDLDFRRPSAHRLIGAHNEFGASEVLLGRTPLEQAMQYVEVSTPPGRTKPALYFLATGTHVSEPAELLGSGRTARLLEGLAAQADLVLLDTPPVLPVADTLVIGRIADGALLVTRDRSTAVPAAQKAKDLMIRNQTRLLGTILNDYEPRRRARGYGSYGYGYPDGTARTLPSPEPALNGARRQLRPL